jgi:AcrR family transcriptional regulator
MSSQDHHHREVVLDRILAEPSTARTGRIPAGYRADIEAFFGDEDGLLLALYARWFDAFNARLIAEPASSSADAPAAMRRAWNAVAEDLPVLQAVLKVHARGFTVDMPAATADLRGVTG